ncbi:MAG: hypothetical protein AB8H86_02335 [Polyangiales bacterium]
MLGFASSASAEEAAPIEQPASEQPAPEPNSSVKFDRLSFRFSTLPLQLEFTQWGIHKRNRILTLDLFTAEVAAVFGGGWTIESSATFMWTEAPGGSIALRGGYAFNMSGGEEGALRSTYAVPLLGYRFAGRPEQDDGTDIYQLTHSVQAGLAFDFFFGRGTAFTMRVFGAYEYAFLSRALLAEQSPDSSHGAIRNPHRIRISTAGGLGLLAQ